jgi:UDP-N-acetylmuramyl pentapeptide synthase
MELSKLLTGLSHKEVRGRVDVDINGLAQDSCQVRCGDLFVAVKGLDADGHDFIADAIRRERWRSSVSGLSLSPYAAWIPFRRGQHWA